MLNNIKIQNYRNFKSLSIEKLGRVNLIIGRNNTGKTSLLEAIFLFTNRSLIDSIDKIIDSRGENNVIELVNSNAENNIRIIDNLFWNKNKEKPQAIEIKSDEAYINLSIKEVWVPEEVREKNFKSYNKIEVRRNEYGHSGNIFLNNPSNELQFFHSEEDRYFTYKNISFIRSTVSNNISNNSNELAAFLDDISLGNNYKDVVEALKIIDNRIERIAYLTDVQTNLRFPVVRLENGERIHLLSMGDGINRILTIILTMVCCEDGFLLIDEFENGLHYSVQEKLWEIIFQLAERLNIQVFATTHSSDTIRAFESIVDQNKTVPLDGLLIKLENINEIIEAIIFEPNELKVITDNLIEVRR